MVGLLDGLLFEPGRWFVIDAGNQRVGRVVVPSLEAGLGLVGSGGVASVVGRVRDEVVVVDVDVAGERGHAVVEQLVGWCTQHGLWSLVRPSGGADGRAHVFVVHEGQEDALRQRAVELRAAWQVPARAVDVRRNVRPLSAPHRGGGNPRPLGPVSELVAQLRTRLPLLQPPGSASLASRTSVGVESAALAPRPRRVTAMLAEWERFLRTGAAPQVAGADQSRSAVEAVATGHLLRAGHTASSAWQVIESAHPRAMSKARGNRRRWVAWVWNRAVREDLEWAATTATRPGGNNTVGAAVATAREALWELAWSVSPRRRPALLLVGHTVLDRMERTGSVRVPVPERDLVLDTGIADRKTIRACLRLLGGAPSGVATEPAAAPMTGLGTLHTATYNPHAKDSSSFEFEIPTHQAPEASSLEGVSQLPPPSFHTPAPGTWALLPLAAHSLWRVLTTHPDLLLLEAAQVAGIPDCRGEVLTPRQARTTREGLAALAGVGLAMCDARGRWSAAATVSAEHAEAAGRVHVGLAEQVGAERAAFRAGGASDWSRAGAAAAKAQRAKEVAWWGGLPRAEQAQRRTRYATAFAHQAVAEQEHLKAGWARRRVADGVDEPGRHDGWLDQLSMDQVITRSVTRAAWFATLPVPLQQAYAGAWRRHRERFGIAMGTGLATSRLEHAAALPDRSAARDGAFLIEQQGLPLSGLSVAAAG